MPTSPTRGTEASLVEKEELISTLLRQAEVQNQRITEWTEEIRRLREEHAEETRQLRARIEELEHGRLSA